MTVLAFEFLVRTACRGGEVRGAPWEEMDIEAREWCIPAERMKTRREHRVPLSTRALAVLREARELADGSGPVFPSVRGGRLSEATIGKLVRDLGIGATSRVRLQDRAAYGGFASRPLDPPQAGPEAFPQGSIAPEARAGSDPDHETTGVTNGGFWDAERPSGGGSFPAPLCAQKAESGFASRRPKRNGANGFRERS